MKRNSLKTHLLLVLAIVLSMSSFAEEFKVKSFKKDESDLAARRFDREDINGEKCAIIKIKTDQQGLKFESGFGIVGNVEFKNGQYWVYVTPGERRLSIYKTGFVRLDYDFPLPIASYAVYHMVLVAEGVQANVLPVTFMVEPADATIKVDGKIIENKKPVELAIGEHRFNAEHSDYSPITEKIIVNKHNVLFEYQLKQAQSQWVTIESDPVGANVYLNEQHKGETPFLMEMTEGQYAYRLDLPLYHSEEGAFDLREADGRKSMNITMRPNFGYVQINTTPESGATIYVDGQLKAQKSPMKTQRLKSGSHHVKVEKNMFYPAEQDVVVEDGKTVTVNMELKPALPGRTGCGGGRWKNGYSEHGVKTCFWRCSNHQLSRKWG